MRKAALLAVLVLVVLAGCGGQTSSSNPPGETRTTATSTDAATPARGAESGAPVERVNVTEDGATLGGVNATKVWERVGRLVGASAADPPVVVVKPGTPNGSLSPPPFARSWGAENHSYAWYTPGGIYNQSAHRVVLWRNPGTTDGQLEAMLAHEFGHAYQTAVDGDLPDETSRFVAKAVREGAVEYVAWTYAQRYTDADAEATRRAVFREASPYGRLVQGVYYLGAKYARNHSDLAAPIESVSETHPRTAEEVLHGLPPGSEPPLNLTVAGVPNEVYDFDAASVVRRGEATLRFLLEYGLSRARAAAAAAGWGDDRWLRFDSDDGHGFAWVVRWDSPREADEFAGAFGDFRANVSEPLALQRVGDETTVVFSGEHPFVRSATATGTAENVTVAA